MDHIWTYDETGQPIHCRDCNTAAEECPVGDVYGGNDPLFYEGGAAPVNNPFHLE